MPRRKGSKNKTEKITIAKVVQRIKKGEPMKPSYYKFYVQHKSSVLKEANK